MAEFSDEFTRPIGSIRVTDVFAAGRFSKFAEFLRDSVQDIVRLGNSRNFSTIPSKTSSVFEIRRRVFRRIYRRPRFGEIRFYPSSMTSSREFPEKFSTGE